jgi:hypothetical protein
MTYGEWSAKWWQWALTQPSAVNPVTDTTGEHCAQGQSGSVWFLAGTFFDPAGPIATIARDCTVPIGKALYFPVLNYQWATYKGDEKACLDVGYASLEECARDALKQGMDDLTKQAQTDEHGLSVVVDDASVDLKFTEQATSPYRVVSPEFEVLIPLDNTSGFTENECYLLDGKLDCHPYYGDGIYLMLAPLAAGSHTIRIAAGSFFDVTYNLNVQPDEATENALQRMRDAVKDLAKISGPPATVTTAQSVIDTLVSASQALAQASIDETIAGGGDPAVIAEAQAEMAEAQEYLDLKRFAKATYHHQQAREELQDAFGGEALAAGATALDANGEEPEHAHEGDSEAANSRSFFPLITR